MDMRSRIERVAEDAKAAMAAPRKEPSRGNSRKGDRHRLVEEKVRLTHEGQSHEAEELRQGRKREPDPESHDG